MEYRKISDEGGLATYAVIFSEGDEAAEGLTRFAKETRLTGASLSGIGAASSATLGWFDFAEKRYYPNEIAEQVEVVSMLGDVATKEDGEPQVHAHIVVAKRDGSAYGGHLLKLHVKPTLEIIVTETPAHLRKRMLKDVPVATIRLTESV